MFEEADLIHRYSRADALRDGVLIDVSETAHSPSRVLSWTFRTLSPSSSRAYPAGLGNVNRQSSACVRLAGTISYMYNCG